MQNPFCSATLVRAEVADAKPHFAGNVLELVNAIHQAMIIELQEEQKPELKLVREDVNVL